MDINRMLHEIWEHDIHWRLGNDADRGIHMYNSKTGVALYADNVEDVIRKLWISLFYTGAQ